ncbi:MAG TPA: HAMP domain-containing sensor histidine kinase [Tepidisphaeraceae bacterium]|jgi:signal transduction histidine kinase
MTRRIAIAILISVWSMLVIAAVAAYFSVRSIMVSDLDSLLYARAIALPELMQPEGFDPSRTPQYDWADTYAIKPDPTRAATPSDKPRLLSATFTNAPDGARQRTLRIAAISKPKTAGAAPVIVEYNGPTRHLDSLLRRIKLALVGFVAIATGVAAAVAVIASRMVLRPLKATANLIGVIDEQSLAERIPLTGMPKELVPVVEQLNRLLERLDRAFAGQKRFVASASHELRTPVAALSTTLELAERRLRENPPVHTTVTQCLAQVHVLRVLVERLMEYVSNDTFNEEDPQDVDVAAVFHQCLDAGAALATEKNIQIHRAGPRPLWCRIPPNRLRSVAMNLIGNAVEYNRPGGRVDMTWIHDGEKLRARVSDDGEGIPTEHLPHIFSPFYRGNKSRQQRGGHLGLGLFIVQSHVKAMNGSCRVDSRPNEGAAFEFEIPCQRIENPVVTPEFTPAA